MDEKTVPHFKTGKEMRGRLNCGRMKRRTGTSGRVSCSGSRATVELLYAGMEATLDMRPEYPRVTVEGDAGDLGLDVAIDPDRAILRQRNRSRDLTRSIGTSRLRAAPDTTRRKTMTQIRRRKTLQLSAASALAAGTGGLAGILASGRAPAYAQTQTMHWLRWSDFVPVPTYFSRAKSPSCAKKIWA